MEKFEVRYTKKVYHLANSIVILTLVLIGLVGAIMALYTENRDRGIQLENLYQKSLMESVDNLNDIEVKLSKLLISNDTIQSAALAHDIYRQSDNTATNLAQLPIEHGAISQTEQFVNQLGDYCHALSKKFSGGQKLSDTQFNELEALYKKSMDLNGNLNEASMQILMGNRIMRGVNNRSKRTPPFSLSFEQMQKQSVDYSGEYGALSDAVINKSYRAIENLQPVSQLTAERYLRGIFEKRGVQSVNYLTEAGGELKTYEFEITFNDNSTMYAQITKSGGMPLMLDQNREVLEGSLSEPQAQEIAREFLERAGFKDMRSIWFSEINGVGFVTLAHYEGAVKVCPDIVKVKVAMDNGEILGLEASSYLKNHVPRNDLKAVISPNTAKSMLSKRLLVNDYCLSVVAIDGSEVLTYEFECEYDGMLFYVYINAEDGQTVDIQRVVVNQGIYLK